MFISEETKFLRNIIVWLLVIAIFVQCLGTPFSGTIRIAHAASTEQTENAPEQSATPVPTEEPKTTEPPGNTEEPKPTETPVPNDGINTGLKEQYRKVLDTLLDENGHLSDDGLLSLKPLPYEEEKYTDVVDNGDGTKTVKLFSSPIKFKNADGNWEYIDNNIVAINSKDNSQHEYKNKASDIKVFMSDNLDQSGAIKLNIRDYSIGFKPLGIVLKEGKSIANLNFIGGDKSEIKEAILDVKKEYSTLEYSNTFNENTDIRITPTSTGVKEDIVFNKMPKESEFSYEFTVENVVPLLRQDGNLYFVDLKTKYRLPL